MHIMKGAFYMKNFIRLCLYGAATAIGVQLGTEAYNKLRNPKTRKDLKNKMSKVKTAIVKES